MAQDEANLQQILYPDQKSNLQNSVQKIFDKQQRSIEDLNHAIALEILESSRVTDTKRALMRNIILTYRETRRQENEWPSWIDNNRYVKDQHYRNNIDTKLGIQPDKTPYTDQHSVSEICRQKIRDVGLEIPKDHQVHHIVPWDHPRAKDARDILKNAGIDPKYDLENLTVLPRHGGDYR